MIGSEYAHQLYGGDISDYMSPKLAAIDYTAVSSDIHSNEQLSKIYTNQVKLKGPVNVTNNSIAFNPSQLIDRQSDDPITLAFKDTLNRVAAEIGLTDVDGSSHNYEYTPSLRDQSEGDILAANNAVMRALKELQDLKNLSTT